MTNEEWIRHAIEEIDKTVFDSNLNILDTQFQISWGKCKGTQVTDCIKPQITEDVNLEDLFPNTIVISYGESDMEEFLGNIAHRCIHAFMNVDGYGKEFKTIAQKYYFEKPFKKYHPSSTLRARILQVYEDMKKKYGDFPGKAVKQAKKGKGNEGDGSKKHQYVMFCPECGYELTIKEKVLKKYGKVTPNCPCCNMKMGIDMGEPENNAELVNESEKI